MTILTVTVDDNEAESVKQMLSGYSSVKYSEDKIQADLTTEKPVSALELTKEIQHRIGIEESHKQIEEISAWQREIRKEWDCDFVS